MWGDDDEPTSSKNDIITVGEDLSLLSVAELTIRIDALKGEITRVQTEIDTKKGQASEAEDLFK